MNFISKDDTVFISDLHLSESTPSTNQFFIYFLQSLIHKARALYILGDFFAYWIGDDNDSLWIKEIIAALREAVEKGLPIYFLHGNRDFLLGGDFFKKTKCQLLPDPSVIELNQKKVLLSHGDLFCTLDRSYQYFRKCVRHDWIKNIFLCLPFRWRLNIANYLRSRPYKKSLTNLVNMDVVQETIQMFLDKYKAHYLIHGHTHKPAIHQWQGKHNLHFQRMVMGAWDENPYILIWSEAKTDFIMKELTVE